MPSGLSTSSAGRALPLGRPKVGRRFQAQTFWFDPGNKFLNALFVAAFTTTGTFAANAEKEDKAAAAASKADAKKEDRKAAAPAAAASTKK